MLTYTIYNKDGEVEWSGTHFDGYTFDSVYESIKDFFIYAIWVGETSKQWAIDNLHYNYMFIVESTTRRDSDEEVNKKTLLLISDETDAMAFKLSCT